MSKQWTNIIIFTVIVLAVYSGWEIYKAFVKSKYEIGEYEKYAASMSNYFDEELLKNMKKLQDEEVLVTDEDITP